MNPLMPLRNQMPQYSRMALGLVCYTSATLLVAALAEKRNFKHIFKQLGQ